MERLKIHSFLNQVYYHHVITQKYLQNRVEREGHKGKRVAVPLAASTTTENDNSIIFPAGNNFVLFIDIKNRTLKLYWGKVRFD